MGIVGILLGTYTGANLLREKPEKIQKLVFK